MTEQNQNKNLEERVHLERSEIEEIMNQLRKIPINENLHMERLICVYVKATIPTERHYLYHTMAGTEEARRYGYRHIKSAESYIENIRESEYSVGNFPIDFCILEENCLVISGDPSRINLFFYIDDSPFHVDNTPPGICQESNCRIEIDYENITKITGMIAIESPTKYPRNYLNNDNCPNIREVVRGADFTTR